MYNIYGTPESFCGSCLVLITGHAEGKGAFCVQHYLFRSQLQIVSCLLLPLISSPLMATNEEPGVLDTLCIMPSSKELVWIHWRQFYCTSVRALTCHYWRELMKCSTGQWEGRHRQALQLSHSFCFGILTHQDHSSVLGTRNICCHVCSVFLKITAHFCSSIPQLPLGNIFVAGVSQL